MKWMLDSDTCIALIKRRPEAAIRRLHSRSIGQVGVSSIVVGELAFGAERSAHRAQNLDALQQFLMALEVAVFDLPAALHYGAARVPLEQLRRPIGPLDMLIAAHALSLDAVLVTHNVREFGRVKGLRIEDWLKP